MVINPHPNIKKLIRRFTTDVIYYYFLLWSKYPVKAFTIHLPSLLRSFPQDVEYIRANYDIENFVYFSHHQCEEHGQLCQFALNPIFKHYAKHFLKEALRLTHKSCLYYRVYPSYYSDKVGAVLFSLSICCSPSPSLFLSLYFYSLSQLSEITC